MIGLLAGLRSYLLLGTVIAAIFGLAGAYVWHRVEVSRAYDRGVSTERAVWVALALDAKIKKLELELQVQKDADAFDDAARKELEAENEKLKEQYDAYIESHGNDGQCLLGDDGAKL